MLVIHAFQQTSNGVVRRNVELRWQQKAWSFPPGGLTSAALDPPKQVQH